MMKEVLQGLKKELYLLQMLEGLRAAIYPIDTKLEKILKDLLNPVTYPSLVNSSASISIPGSKLLEKGTVLSTTLIVYFNRSPISPTYGTSGQKSGTVNGYSLKGSTFQANNSFPFTVSEYNKQI